MLGDGGKNNAQIWLQNSADEQLRRFESRLADPAKRWKMNEEDWRNRAKWAQYEEAVEDMLRETSTQVVPWTVVEGNDKRWARIKVLRAVVGRLRAALSSNAPNVGPGVAESDASS